MGKKLTTKDFIRRAKKIHGDRYNYSLVDYVNSKHPITIICSIHGEFQQSPNAHTHSTKPQGCPHCGLVKRVSNRTKTHDEYIEQARIVHNGFYDYSETQYIKSHNDITIICPIHGEFQQSANSHLRGQGCVRCGIDKNVNNQTDSIDDWIIKSREVHGNTYDYSKANYTGSNKKLTIICPIHGEFQQQANTHRQGGGCKMCGISNISDARRLSLAEWVNDAVDIHNNKYDYSLVDYTNGDDTVRIICPIHGEFQQQANTHRQGGGCMMCGGKYPLDNKSVIDRATKIHGNKYDYSSVVYQSSDHKITIGCPIHGEFKQLPHSHMRGNGCPSCTHHQSSGENEVRDFLLSMGLKIEQSRRDIIPPKELDLYLPEYDIAIEYCGLYWHNESKGKDSKYHLQKYDACDERNIRLITIFEDEWKYKKDIVKAFLIHLVGKSPKGVMGRKAVIKEISWTIAKDFLNKHHLQGAGGAGKHRVGAYDIDDNLLAVMVFGGTSDERGDTGEIEMKRFVTDKSSHAGLGSKMMKWASGYYDFSRVHAFVDRRWFTGEFKEHSGFTPISITNPTFSWTDNQLRHHRRVETKKTLIEKYQFNSSMTKLEMMRSLGYNRIWDCGKIKMEWSKKMIQ